MSIRKRFDKQLFEDNDKISRAAATKYFENKGFVVKPNPQRYGPDLMLFKKENFIGFVETEIKRVWKDEDFKYADVQFPERKGKYVDKDPITFFMMNDTENRALLVEGKDVVGSPIKEVPNKYVFKGEKFFIVPLEKVKFIKLS